MPRRMWVSDPNAGGTTIPKDVKERTTARIERYAEKHFKGKYTRLSILFRAQFCYIDAYQEPGPQVYVPKGMSRDEVIDRLRNTPTKLCRLRYFGKEDAWSMGFFKYSDEQYELCAFGSGEFYGTPEEGFEIAAGVYLE